MRERDWGPSGLETKFARGGGLTLGEGATIAGYASVFGQVDQGGDRVERGAFARSLATGRKVRMLWQHDPREPIGVWDEVREDDRGLWVKGRILTDVARGREAAALVTAGAIEGLSIGYRTRRAERDREGGRILAEVELWEVSLVTFPMLGLARVDAKADRAEDDLLAVLAAAFVAARREIAGG